PALRRAARWIRWDRILADAAFDSEPLHRLSREELGIRSCVIPINTRGFRKWPSSKYRRQMRRRFWSRIYQQRVHVETPSSMDKRQLGSFLRSRKESSRFQEVLLRVLVHNLAILLRIRYGFYGAYSVDSFQQSSSPLRGALAVNSKHVVQ